MKEIKAYVRRSKASSVVDALLRAGCRDFSAIDVRGLVRELPAREFRYSGELGDNYEPVVKLEIVCHDQDAPRLVEVIRTSAHTGEPGDGVVFVAPIDDAIRIRDGRRGTDALLT